MSLKEDIENFIPEVEQHVRSFFEGHATEIDHGIKVAEAAESDPGVQALMSAVSITAPARAAIGEFLTKLDAEFTRLAAEAHENGRLAGHAEAAAAQAPAAEPEVPPAE